MSINEELRIEGKNYPDNQQRFNVPVNQYCDALTQHVGHGLSQRLQQLTEQDQFDQGYELAQQLNQLLEPQQAVALPLQRVVYSQNETVKLPQFDDYSLINPALITNDKTASTVFSPP